MKPSIIVSTKDLAGMNIREALVGMHGFRETTETFKGNPVFMKEGIKLYTLSEETIQSDAIDEEVEGDFLIFATRHKSEAGTKSFTTHVPGNWGKAEAGGKEKKLCNALPLLMKDALNKIKNVYTGDEFEIVQECTHHGPAIEKPCMFIEIGSKEEEWKRQDAGEVIANVVNYIVMNKPKRCKSVIVLGGGHYNQVATKLMLNSEFAVGHICPKYNLANLDAAMIRQAIERNGENFDRIVLDWKGLGPEKQRIKKMLDELGVKYEKYKGTEKEEE